MRSVLLALLSVLNRWAASCPATCLVCSDEAIICHKLSVIIGVPLTARAVMLTDGQISSVDNSAFSGLTEITVLGLSNNNIADILKNAFQNLSALRTLLLDHNKITTSSIPESTFSQLHSLEILQLGNNALRAINGKWFQDTRSLLTLQLEGNLITRVESGTFSSSNLNNLKTLDLSGNLIMYIAKGSFHNLPQLHSLDLSRNRLHSAPDAFSSLPWLSKLNLVLNQWNCTCELWELSTFLSSYLRTPGKELCNSEQLVCLSSANSAVQNVVQLTEANCMLPNKSTTKLVKIKDRISMQKYIRDISLAATFFFAGGVGVILGAMYCKMELGNNKKPMRNRSTDVVAPGESMLNQGAPWWGFNDDNKVQILSIANPGNAEAKLMQLNEEETSKAKPWLREMARQDLKQARPDYCFMCHSCSRNGLVSSSTGGRERAGRSRAIVVQSDSWLATVSGKQKKLAPREEEDGEHMPWLVLNSNEDCPGQRDQNIYQRHYNNRNHDFTMMPTILHADAEIRGASNQNLVHMSSRNTPKQINFIQSRERLNASKESCDKLPHNEGKLQNIQTLPDYLTTKCVHCSQTIEYWQGSNRERGKTMEVKIDQTCDQQYKREENTEDKINHKQDPTYVDYSDHHIRKPCIKLPQRKVSFDLRESGSLKNEFQKEAKIQNTKKSDNLKSTQKLSSKTSNENKGRKKVNVRSNSLLKVKINLNPFRKSRIHAQKNLNKEEKNKKAASKMAKRAKLSVSAEQGDGDRSETTDTDTQKPEKLSKKHHKKSLQNKLSQSTDSTKTAGSQKINTKNNKEGHHQSMNDDANLEEASLVTSTEDEELRKHQLGNEQAKQASSILLHSPQDSLETTATQPQSSQTIGHPQTDTTDPLSPEMTGTSVHPLTSHSPSAVDVLNPEIPNDSRTAENVPDGHDLSNRPSTTAVPSAPTLILECLPSAEGSPKRKIRLIIPERTSSRSQTPLDKKIR